MMSTLFIYLEKNHKLIIVAQALIILFFATACILHDVIPVCHYLFGCDHRMH
jgi:hypothetical protein